MSDEIQPASNEELWEMVQSFSKHAENLERKIAIEQEKNAGLNTENSGWLKIYQRHLSEIADLKSEISRLESLIRGSQAES